MRSKEVDKKYLTEDDVLTELGYLKIYRPRQKTITYYFEGNSNKWIRINLNSKILTDKIGVKTNIQLCLEEIQCIEKIMKKCLDNRIIKTWYF
jgi:hypothetical protein